MIESNKLFLSHLPLLLRISINQAPHFCYHSEGLNQIRSSRTVSTGPRVAGSKMYFCPQKYLAVLEAWTSLRNLRSLKAL